MLSNKSNYTAPNIITATMDCYVCGKSLSRPDALKRHLQFVHTTSAAATSNVREPMEYTNEEAPTGAINLKIRAGSTLMLAGPSSSGKTT